MCSFSDEADLGENNVSGKVDVEQLNTFHSKFIVQIVM